MRLMHRQLFQLLRRHGLKHRPRFLCRHQPWNSPWAMELWATKPRSLLYWAWSSVGLFPINHLMHSLGQAKHVTLSNAPALGHLNLYQALSRWPQRNEQQHQLKHNVEDFSCNTIPPVFLPCDFPLPSFYSSMYIRCNKGWRWTDQSTSTWVWALENLVLSEALNRWNDWVGMGSGK